MAKPTIHPKLNKYLNSHAMNLQTVNTDIKALEQALKIVEKTENYLHFKKSHLIFELCEQINVLKEKRDRQIQVLRNLQSA